MDTSKIKAYAPNARREFIQAVTEKANSLGLSDDRVDEIDIKGDVVIIGGRAFPKSIAEPRQKLIERIKRDGFEQVMEAIQSGRIADYRNEEYSNVKFLGSNNSDVSQLLRCQNSWAYDLLKETAPQYETMAAT